MSGEKNGDFSKTQKVCLVIYISLESLLDKV